MTPADHANTANDALDTLSRIVGEHKGPTTGGWYAVTKLRAALDALQAQAETADVLEAERDQALKDSADMLAHVQNYRAERDAAVQAAEQAHAALQQIAEVEPGEVGTIFHELQEAFYTARQIARDALAGNQP